MTTRAMGYLPPITEMPRQVFAPPAPIPTDATRCRWCRGTLRVLFTPGVADYCERGCAKTHEMPTVGQCPECGREFKTGLPLMTATLCYACDELERRAYEAGYAEPGTPTYRFEILKRGGIR